jgi:quercetin dioxygenase-like cupin family protein
MAANDPEQGSTRPAGLTVGPGEGEAIRSPIAGEVTFLARGEQTNGALTALDVVVPPGQGPPLHVHAREDETIWVLEGDVRFKLDGELKSGPAGTFVFIPHGVAHCFQNVGEQPARFFATITPAGLETFFERLAGLTAFDPDAFRRAAAEEGTMVVGPPLAESDPLPARDRPTTA